MSNAVQPAQRWPTWHPRGPRGQCGCGQPGGGQSRGRRWMPRCRHDETAPGQVQDGRGDQQHHHQAPNDLGPSGSPATDVYPGTATVSFRAAHYQSTGLTLRTTELADDAGRPLQAQTPLDTRLIDAFDVPPYVNSADQSGAVPFLDIANRYILSGAQYNPQVLAGLSAAQIADQLRNPASPVARAIDGSAQVIVAAIGQVLHDETGPPATGVSGG